MDGLSCFIFLLQPVKILKHLFVFIWVDLFHIIFWLWSRCLVLEHTEADILSTAKNLIDHKQAGASETGLVAEAHLE